jgi:hypothetical protein
VKAPFYIQVSEEGYGNHCDRCKQVTSTTRINFMQRQGEGGRILRQSHLCAGCIEDGVEIDLNLEMGPDPEKSKLAKERIKTSRKLEKVLADDLGGRPQPGSGGTRLHGYKGDVRVMGKWRLEHKYTDSLHYYKLTLLDLAKITGLALEANEKPALIVEFNKAREAFAVLPYSLFKELIDAPDNDR